MTSTSQATDSAANKDSQTMRGKYDKRTNVHIRGGKRINAGRKPYYAKHLSKNTAAYLFANCDVREKLAELLGSPDARLRFEVIKYLWDRLEGRPFVAENPNVVKPATILNQDNRLQIAIQQLLPPKPSESTAKRKRKANQLLIEGGSGADRAAELEPGASTPQLPGHPSSREAGGRS